MQRRTELNGSISLYIFKLTSHQTFNQLDATINLDSVGCLLDTSLNQECKKEMREVLINRLLIP